MPTPNRLSILIDLRREAALSQADMARLCGLTGSQSHQTAGAWERGEYAPGPRRRTDFAHYLWDHLGLRRKPEQFEQIWQLLTEEWGWEVWSDAEWRGMTSQPRSAWLEEKAEIPQAAVRAPFQAPVAPTHFVGREDEQAALQAFLTAAQPESPLVGLVGMGGVGKSSLAAHMAHRLRAHFTGGVLWGHLGASEPGAILESWGQALGNDFHRLPDVESRAAAFRDAVANRRLLVVLDNGLQAQALLPLLPGGPDCRVLLTTRSQDLTHALHAQVVLLDSLGADQSLTLLGRIMGEERMAGEVEAAQTICRLLDHLPLAVEITAQRLRARPERSLTQMADRLASVQSMLAELQISDRAVRTSFAASWEQLTQPQQYGFACLAVFEGRSFDRSAFAPICRLESYDGEEILFALAALSLVSPLGDGRYRQHALLAEFAGEKLAATDQSEQVWGRFAQHFCDLAQEGEGKTLAEEWGNLWAGMTQAYRLQRVDLVLAYADSLTPVWRAQARFDQAREAYGWAVAAGHLVGDGEQVARYQQAWGFACLEQDAYAEAQIHLTQAIQGWTAMGESVQRGACHLLLARMALEQGWYAAAHDQLAAGWQLFSDQDDLPGLAQTLYWEGVLAYFEADFATARIRAEEAHGLQQGLPDQTGLIPTLRLLADLAIHEQDLVQARHHAQEALALSHSLQEQGEEAAALYILGVIARMAGEREQAERALAQALALFMRMGDRGYQSMTLFEQSKVHFQAGDLAAAETLAQRSRQLAEEIGDINHQIYVLRHLGRIYTAMAKPDTARTLLHHGLNLATTHNHILTAGLQDQLNSL